MIVLSLHDVAPASFPESVFWVEELERRSLRATLLVIPGPWRGAEMRPGSRFASWLLEKERAGHEIGLHGWSHQQERPGPAWARALARGAAEFAGLPSTEQRRRVEAGVRRLGESGLNPVGFTPPGWVSGGVGAPVAEVGLRYITSHGSILDFGTGRRHRIPVVCHRPGSVLARPGALVLRAGVMASRVTAIPLRLAIHADDAGDPWLVAATLAALDSVRGAGREMLPYARFLEAA